MRLREALGFAALSLTAAAGPADARSATRVNEDRSPLLRPDPQVVMGRLANGMRYAVMQHPSHGREVLTLHMDVGSLDELEGEQGAAHFLEHLAFNGSTNFPAGTLMGRFETAGFAFGHDQNATTTATDTSYTLELPDVTAGQTDLGLSWLRDVGDGLTLSDAEISRGRGVVLSEYRDGLGPGKTIGEAQLRFAFPGAPYADRLPIGRKEVVEQLDARRLRSFYARWYRPENAILVAVGDVPASVMKARIEQSFSTWRATGPVTARPSRGAVDFARPPAVLVQVEPHLTTTVTVCRYSPKPPHRPEDVEVTRRRLLDQIWTSALADRTAKLARTDGGAIAARAGYDVAYRSVGGACFAALARTDDWRGALRQVAAESRRLERYSVTDKELAAARRRILASDDLGVASQATRSAGSVASSILSNLIEGDTFDTAEEQRRVDRLALEGVTPDLVRAQFATRWTTAAPPLIVVASPKPLSRPDVEQVWAMAMTEAPPSAPVDAADAKWAYASFGPAGHVVRREALEKPDFVRLTLSNGVVVNCKQTGFSKDQVMIQAMFGAGRQELPIGTAFLAGVAQGLLLSGGLERNSYNDLEQVCTGRTCGAILFTGADLFTLSGATRREDLDLELQLLAAVLTEPAFRPEMTTSLATGASAVYRALKVSPVALAALTLQQSLPEPHAADLPSEQTVAAIQSTDVKALLNGPLRDDPLEVTVVGDVDEATMLRVLLQTLGAIPVRRAGGAPLKDAVLSRYAADAPPPMEVRHEGSKDQAAVELVWPLFDWTPARQHESRAVMLLARVMQDQVLDEIRQKLGLSYSPSVAANLPRGGDQGALAVLVTTSPASAAVVRDEVLKVAARLAKGELSPDQLERARAPILQRLVTAQGYDTWWLAALGGSNRHPDQLTDAETALGEERSVTLAEVKQAAVRWLSRRPYVVTALPADETHPAADVSGGGQVGRQAP